MKSTILRNGSGYYDPTAFGAIKNIIKSEKVKKVKTMEKGEIWEIQQNNGSYKDVIVIAAHDDIAQVIQVSDIEGSYSLRVNCQGIRYTDPRRIQYAFNDNFTNFIRKMTDDEFETIMDAVAEVLGLEMSQPAEVVEPQEEWHAIPEPDIMPLPFECDPEALIKAQTERDVYKGLYEKLLADVMKG